MRVCVGALLWLQHWVLKSRGIYLTLPDFAVILEACEITVMPNICSGDATKLVDMCPGLLEGVSDLLP